MTQKQTIFYFGIGVANVIAGMASIAWLVYLTKPLLLLSLAIFYYSATKHNPKSMDKAMIAALLLSCCGDCFLMFQDMAAYYFVLGLGSFLLAHIFYIYVFSRDMKLELFKILPVVIYGIFMLYYLLSHVQSDVFIVPICAYIIVISTMIIAAISRKATPKSYKMVLFGAILFAFSDSCIGINKFVNPIPFATFWIMTTYIMAQFFILKGILVIRN